MKNSLGRQLMLSFLMGALFLWTAPTNARRIDRLASDANCTCKPGQSYRNGVCTNLGKLVAALKNSTTMNDAHQPRKTFGDYFTWDNMKSTMMDGHPFTKELFEQLSSNNVLIACYDSKTNANRTSPPEIAGGTFKRDPLTGKIRVGTSLHLILNDDLTPKMSHGSKCYIWTGDGKVADAEIDMNSVKATVSPCKEDPMTGLAISTENHRCNLLNYPDKMDIGLTSSLENQLSGLKVIEEAKNPAQVGQTVLTVTPWTAAANFNVENLPQEISAGLPSAQIASVDMLGVPGAHVGDKSFSSYLTRIEIGQSGSPVYAWEDNQIKLIGHVEGKGKTQDFTQFAPANYATQNIVAFNAD